MPPQEEHTLSESAGDQGAHDSLATTSTPEQVPGEITVGPATPKKPQQSQVLMLVGLGAVLAFAAGAYAFGTLLGGDSSTPLEKVAAAWEEVDTFVQETALSFSIEMTMPGDDTQENETTRVDFELEGESRVDRTDRTALKADGTFEIDLGVDAGMFAFNEGLEFDLRLDGTTAYVQITKLPAILALFGMGALRDEWIITELEDVQSIAEVDQVAPLPDGTDMIGVFQFQEGALTEEELRRLTKIAAEYDTFSLEETQETDVVVDENGTHTIAAYEMVLHKDEILALYDRVVAELRDKMNESQLADAANTRKSFAYVFENLTINTARLWVDDSYLVYRIEIDALLAVDNAELESLSGDGNNGGHEGQSKLVMVLDGSFSNFNVPVSIEYPENARPLEEILESMGMQTNAPSEEPVFFTESGTPAEVSERAEFLSNVANVLAPFGFE